MSMGDLSAATGGLVNCKANVEIGMPLSEVYRNISLGASVQKYPTMGVCAVNKVKKH